MSLNITLNGSVYIIPETGEVGWGGNTTSYLVAIAAGVLQKTGGSFTLSAELDFGASFGLKSLYYKSRSTNVASSGILRLNNNSDAVSWRNFANSGDLPLIVDTSDRLLYNGNPVLTGTTPSAYVSSITGTANQVIASAATGPVTLSLPQSIATSSAVQFGTLGLGSSIVASSILSLTSTTLGFLPPRMTTVERDAIVSPATGLFIYNTSTGVNNYYNGVSWVAIAAGGTINTGTAGFFSYYPATGTTLDDQPILSTNGTNISIGSGQLLLPAGTQALPSVSLSGDPDTGVYSVGANQVSITGGANLIFNFGVTQSNLYISSASRFQWESTAYLPNVDNSIDLGTTIMNWRSLYISTSLKNGATTLATVTELGYLTGVTSTIQTQLNGKASTTLNNLGATAINTNLVSSTNNSDDLGSAAINWSSLYLGTSIKSGATTLATTTELGYLTGVTSAIQTQLNGKASTTLNNLGTTAINNALIPGSDNAVDLGTSAATFRTLYLGTSLSVKETGGADTATILVAALAASRTYTIPDAGAAASFMMTEGAQTVNGQQTFGAAALFANGTVSLPGIAFSNDTDCGMYRIGTNNIGISTNGVNALEISSAQAVTIRGTATNNAAAAGYVGEEIISTFNNVAVAATDTYTDGTTISLTAGDWDVYGFGSAGDSSATAVSVWITGIGTASGNTAPGTTSQTTKTAIAGTILINTYSTVARVSLSATTTYRLKIFATYTGTAPTFGGTLRARRIR